LSIINIKGGVSLQEFEFGQFYEGFVAADLDTKIELYCSTENLSTNQYKKLLRTLTPSQFKRLEKEIR
jgi:hypothetical protein